MRRFKRSDAIEICDGITFDFYTGLPHVYVARHAAMYSIILTIHIYLKATCSGLRIANFGVTRII